MSGKKEKIDLKPIGLQYLTVSIEGDSDLVLNKMSDPTCRELTDIRKDKAKSNEKVNYWEDIITKIHWRDGKPKVFTEESLIDALKNNAPCIPDFAFYKTFGDAVVRNGIDKYKTKFCATVNLFGENGLTPVKFARHRIDEVLMSPKKGKPVLVHLNVFSGWSADIKIAFMETAYSAEQIINIINLAGFGIGIGSSRNAGRGRFHVVGIKSGI